MRFLNSTPQTVGDYLAKQESRQASKRKSAHDTALEPSSKKQKLIHSSMPPTPTQVAALAHSQAHATTYFGSTDEEPKLVDKSLPPNQPYNKGDLDALTNESKPLDIYLPSNLPENHDMVTSALSNKKRNSDHCSITLAQGHNLADPGLATQDLELGRGSLLPAQAQAHDRTQVEPTTKKPRLSYASLPPDRRARISNEERERIFAVNWRKRLSQVCNLQGYDSNILDQVPDTLLTSNEFDIWKFIAAQSSETGSRDGSEDDLCPIDGPAAETLTTEGTVEHDAKGLHEPEICNISQHSPTLDNAAPTCPVNDEASVRYTSNQDLIGKDVSISREGTSYPPPIQNKTAKASLALGDEICQPCPPLGYHVFTSSSSLNSILCGPDYYSSDLDTGYTTKAADLDQTVFHDSPRELDEDTPATSSDQIDPSSPDPSPRDNTITASSSQTPPDGPVRNKGGRPRGRKPRAPKTPKGPTRFQKNHPISARINIDVWANILVFCPPEFLLKARSISTTFKSVLEDDSPIWKIARVNYYGADMPGPPLDISERQYADLVTGTGCQTRGCTSTKTRKTYWALQKRLCIECFHKSFLPVRITQHYGIIFISLG